MWTRGALPGAVPYADTSSRGKRVILRATETNCNCLTPAVFWQDTARQALFWVLFWICLIVLLVSCTKQPVEGTPAPEVVPD